MSLLVVTPFDPAELLLNQFLTVILTLSPIFVLIFVLGIMYKLLSFVIDGSGPARVSRREMRLREEAAIVEQERALEVSNRASVQGVQYALDSGSIRQEQLRTMQPEQLQELIDSVNPAADLIVQCVDRLREFEGVDTVTGLRGGLQQARRAQLVAGLRQLREAPQTLRLKAIGQDTDRLIREVKRFNKDVDQLPEG